MPVANVCFSLLRLSPSHVLFIVPVVVAAPGLCNLYGGLSGYDIAELTEENII